MILFISGLVVGSIGGVLVMGLLVAARGRDECMPDVEDIE